MRTFTLTLSKDRKQIIANYAVKPAAVRRHDLLGHLEATDPSNLKHSRASEKPIQADDLISKAMDFVASNKDVRPTSIRFSNLDALETVNANKLAGLRSLIGSLSHVIIPELDAVTVSEMNKTSGLTGLRIGTTEPGTTATMFYRAVEPESPASSVSYG